MTIRFSNVIFVKKKLLDNIDYPAIKTNTDKKPVAFVLN
jgi:hypothetical protein